MSKITLGITGLHEILGRDYGIKEPYWAPSSISLAQPQRGSSSTIPIRIRIELGFKDVLFCTKWITEVPGENVSKQGQGLGAKTLASCTDAVLFTDNYNTRFQRKKGELRSPQTIPQCAHDSHR